MEVERTWVWTGHYKMKEAEKLKQNEANDGLVW